MSTNVATISAETLERRAKADVRLEPLTSQYDEKLAIMQKIAPHATSRLLSQNFPITARLAKYLGTMRSVVVGDTGPILQETLRQVCVVLGWQVIDAGGLAKLDKAIDAVTGIKSNAANVTKAAQKHAANIAAQTPTPVVPAPVVTPVAAAVQQTVAAPAPVETPEPVAVMAKPKGKSKAETAKIIAGQLSPAMLAYPQGNWVLASTVFGIKSLVGFVEVFDGSHTSTPKIDPDYVWDKDVLQELVASTNEDVPTQCWLVGERGTGKSSAAKQFAAYLGRPFYKVTFDKFTERSTIIGGKGLSGGNTTWEDGQLTMALRPSVPAVVLLDEICYAQTDAVSGPINEIVHPDCTYFVTETGERITFDRRTFFIAADNTNGSGDVTGRYHGARPLNRATIDRFGRFIGVDHMSRAEEIKALMARAVCDKDTASKVADLMTKLRAKCNSGALADPPSLREAIAFARDLRAGILTPARSFDGTFVRKYPVEAHEELRLTFQSVWVATPDATSTPVDAGVIIT